MDIQGPERYALSYTPTSWSVLGRDGSSRFSGMAKADCPKLYIASIEKKPIYVGITKRPMRERLTYGWKASGRSGYYGYAWRHHGNDAVLDVWGQMDAVNRNERDIETVEAEVVYLIRHRTGQWPQFQTEIHFFQSTHEHRQAAERILASFDLEEASPPVLSQNHA
jgi:hypothetical protein